MSNIFECVEVISQISLRFSILGANKTRLMYNKGALLKHCSFLSHMVLKSKNKRDTFLTITQIQI